MGLHSTVGNLVPTKSLNCLYFVIADACCLVLVPWSLLLAVTLMGNDTHRHCLQVVFCKSHNLSSKHLCRSNRLQVQKVQVQVQVRQATTIAPTHSVNMLSCCHSSSNLNSHYLVTQVCGVQSKLRGTSQGNLVMQSTMLHNKSSRTNSGLVSIMFP